MFLSLQTYKNLKIYVHSHIEAIQFLLGEGFKYVLTQPFMQDVSEDYFGHQRAKGGRADNPTAQQFVYNDLTIAAQRDIAPVLRGNVGGTYEKQKWGEVSDVPVKKRKKKHQNKPVGLQDILVCLLIEFVNCYLLMYINFIHCLTIINFSN